MFQTLPSGINKGCETDLSLSRMGWMSTLPYFCPPPVPLTCVCEKPLTASGMGAQPALGIERQSGPGFTMPKGMDGPMNVRPNPSLPMRGSTWPHRSWSPATAGRAVCDKRRTRESSVRVKRRVKGKKIIERMKKVVSMGTI